MTTVEVRSYSRYSGKMRLEIDKGTSSSASAEAMRSSCSGCRNENNSEIEIASTRALLQFLDERSEIAFLERLENFAGRDYPFANSEPQLVVNERRRLDRVEIVKLRSRLAPDGKHVFETFRRDERNTSPATL